MPYLGQNLDALGVIRASPNWDEAPQKKENMPAKPSPQQIHQQLGMECIDNPTEGNYNEN